MQDTDKVIIALGFFTLVGFVSYLYFMRITATPALELDNSVTATELQKMRERRNGIPAKW